MSSLESKFISVVMDLSNFNFKCGCIIRKWQSSPLIKALKKHNCKYFKHGVHTQPTDIHVHCIQNAGLSFITNYGYITKFLVLLCTQFLKCLSYIYLNQKEWNAILTIWRNATFSYISVWLHGRPDHPLIKVKQYTMLKEYNILVKMSCP